MKHIYFCQEDKPEDPVFDEDYEGYAFVARSAGEAIKLSGMGYAEDMLRDNEAEELPLGLVDKFEGLRRQIYSYIEGKCPNCDNPSKFAKLFWDEDTDKIHCSECPEFQ